METRIINTVNIVMGPHGHPYLHDSARPFAALIGKGIREIAIGRYPSYKAAQKALAARGFNIPATL